MNYTVGFIGCGNMGGALLNAVLQTVNPASCCVCETQPEKVVSFTEQGVALLSANEVVTQSDIVFLAVKPQVLGEVVHSFTSSLNPKKLPVFVTMAAGTTIATLESFLDTPAPVIRIMPNLPCSVGKGVILYCTNTAVSDSQKQQFFSLLSPAGLLDEIAEADIDAASVVSCCGPAFVFAFAEALANGAAACGLDKQRALLYAARTLEGAATLMEYSDKEVTDLIKAVCSPKGTTIEGIESLEKNGFATVVGNAVKASYHRTVELSQS
jgi:pyrroline-5-carboxylate reductase